VASSDFCPVAAFTVGSEVFCIQPHPEFVEDFSAYLLNKRRSVLGEERVVAGLAGLQLGHEGSRLALLMMEFLQKQER
jgi:hypothetical protein